MTLRRWFARLIVERDLSKRTEETYRLAIVAFERWLGRQATVADLARHLSAFIRHRAQRGSKYTTKSLRAALVAILNAAVDARLVRRPNRIRPVRCPQFLPQHVPLEFFAAIAAVCHLLPYGRILQAGSHVAYDAGLRLGNVTTVLWTDLSPDGILTVVQRKSGRIHVAYISPATIAMCRAIQVPSDPRMVPWPFGRHAWAKWYRKLRALAGYRVKKLGVQSVRRTGADRIAREHGVAAAVRYLGHAPASGESVARQFYLSAEAQGFRPVQPPPLPPPIED